MTDTRPPEVKISLRLTGAPFDPDEVTSRLGIEPTHHFRAGDPMPFGHGRRRWDLWRVTVGPTEAYDIDAMLDQLRHQVSAPAAQIRDLCAELALESQVFVTTTPAGSLNPSLRFSSEFVAWAAELGALIDVDVRAYEGEG